MTIGHNDKIQGMLVDRFAQADTAPVLFVGSGFSRRYLGLEDWSGLLKRFSILTGKNFNYFLSKAEGNLPETAKLISQEFFEIWWNDPKYTEEREEWGEACTRRCDPLKIQIAQYMVQRSEAPTSDSLLTEELAALRLAQVDAIITTNWDVLIEALFPGFTVFVGQKETIFRRSHAIAEIFKIHGCATKPSSLVLTSDDYADFSSRNPYLAAKLLTLLLEHPVVFMGYSISDPHIHDILASVLTCLDGDQTDRLARRLIFAKRAGSEDPSVSTATIGIGANDLRVTTVSLDSFVPLHRALALGERRIDAKVLRQIKDRIYELVETNDPAERLAVLDIDDLDEHTEVEFVVGLGVTKRLGEKGLEAITATDLLLDVVRDSKQYNRVAAELIKKTIPSLLRGNSKNVPVYKFLSLSGQLDECRMPIREEIPERVFEVAMLPKSEFEDTMYNYRRSVVENMSIGEIVLEYGRETACSHITFILPPVDELETFLRENVDLLTKGKNSVRNWYRKLVCIYDRLKWGPGFPKARACGGSDSTKRSWRGRASGSIT